jgi:surface antigen
MLKLLKNILALFVIYKIKNKKGGVEMSKKYILLITVLVIFAMFAISCNRAELGSTIGGLGGAAVGGQIGDKKHRGRNAIIGAFAGAVIGYIVGNEMDKYDKQKLNETFETVPSHKKVKWVNPDNNNRYEVTPEPAYTADDGRPCRDAYIQAVINGEYKQVKTTACRNNNGQWEIIK